MSNQENDQIQERRRHIAEIAALGHPIYPHRFDRTHTITAIVDSYGDVAGKKDDQELERVNAALRAGGPSAEDGLTYGVCGEEMVLNHRSAVAYTVEEGLRPVP